MIGTEGARLLRDKRVEGRPRRSKASAWSGMIFIGFVYSLKQEPIKGTCFFHSKEPQSFYEIPGRHGFNTTLKEPFLCKKGIINC